MSSIKVHVSVETLHNKHHGKENWVATLDIRTLNFDCQIFIKASYLILTYFSFHICSILTFIVSISVRILFTLFLCRFAFSLQKSDEKSSSAATRSTAMHENNIVTNISGIVDGRKMSFSGLKEATRSKWALVIRFYASLIRLAAMK